MHRMVLDSFAPLGDISLKTNTPQDYLCPEGNVLRQNWVSFIVDSANFPGVNTPSVLFQAAKYLNM